MERGCAKTLDRVYLFLLLNPSSEVIASTVIFLLPKENFFEDGLVSLCSRGCPGTQSVNQAGLALYLPLHPKCWDEKRV